MPSKQVKSSVARNVNKPTNAREKTDAGVLECKGNITIFADLSGHKSEQAQDASKAADSPEARSARDGDRGIPDLGDRRPGVME